LFLEVRQAMDRYLEMTEVTICPQKDLLRHASVLGCPA